MRVQSITIRNIMGIRELDIEPGKVTVVSGDNATGKTSVLEAVRSVLRGGHDATLLRRGAERGEVVLVLDDGTEIKKTVTPDKSDTKVQHEKMGRLGQPATYVRGLVDALSVNPVDFLAASRKERLEILLSAVPAEIDLDELLGLTRGTGVRVSLDERAHPIDNLEAVRVALFAARTEANRECKDKAATAVQLRAGLPAEGEASVAESLREAERAKADLERQREEQRASIRQECTELVRGIAQRRAEEVARIDAELQATIDKLRAARDVEVRKVTAQFATATEDAGRDKDRRLADVDAALAPEIESLAGRVGTLRARLEEQGRIQANRELAERMESDATAAESRAAKLTAGLERVEALKEAVLERIPIKGLSVQDGDLYVGRVPFDRVNESAKVKVAIQVAKLRAGELGLIAVDGLERLSPATFAAFRDEALRARGCQFIVARVTEGELAVEALER